MGHEIKEPSSLDFTVELLEQVLKSRKQGSVPIGRFFEKYNVRKEKEEDIKEKEVDKPITTTIEQYPLGVSPPKFNISSSIPSFDSKLIVQELKPESIRELLQSIYKDGFKIDSSKEKMADKELSLVLDVINVSKKGIIYASLTYYPQYKRVFIVSPQLHVTLFLDGNLLREPVKLMKELDSKVEGIGTYYLGKKEKRVPFTHAMIIDPTLKPTTHEPIIAYGSIAYGLMTGNYNKELMGNINLKKQER